MEMSVWDYIRSLQCMDFETFQNLVDTNCDVTYVFNGELGRCTGAEFVTRLKKGHFENTKKCDMTRMSVEKIPPPLHGPQDVTLYSISDDTIYDRLGLGRDEDGPGKYDMRSEGLVTFQNGKVVRMMYSFVKVKCASINELMITQGVGGANAVAEAEIQLFDL